MSQDIVDALYGKQSKTSVDYSDHGHMDAHCAICGHYLNKNTCEIVAGKIAPSGWCKRFRKK